MKKVKDFEIEKPGNLKEILGQMEEIGGFQGNKVAKAVNILERMINDKKSLNFLSFPACLVATGIRGIFREMVRRNWFDLVITTCGTLDHDLARIWGDYYQGSFELNDEEVKKKGFSRLGNVLVPDKVYADQVEKNVQKFLNEIYEEKKELATYELVWEFGKRLDSKDSIIYWATKNKIPVIVPGITDGMIGYQLWMFSQDKDFKINVLKDEQLLSDKVWEAEKTGALIVGGGISKHHTIWWNQFKGGLDYAVYLSTAIEADGSLSGARPREAVSWGQIKKNAEKTFIFGEASSILPLITYALAERLQHR
ncbi:deoxyhypusine synthase [Candidatus Bathyarchaeota archaeon]|nr:deoxyhypusine synthase [Candidatus Bathyarchaeota archaeon]MCK4668546.1 deoxyhypusine synthase [Candidatus Bathyarchaeota archaeon]